MSQEQAMRAGHKYLRRQFLGIGAGGKRRYRYWYTNPVNGNLHAYTGREEQPGHIVTEHAYRRVSRVSSEGANHRFNYEDGTPIEVPKEVSDYVHGMSQKIKQAREAETRTETKGVAAHAAQQQREREAALTTAREQLRNRLAAAGGQPDDALRHGAITRFQDLGMDAAAAEREVNAAFTAAQREGRRQASQGAQGTAGSGGGATAAGGRGNTPGAQGSQPPAGPRASVANYRRATSLTTKQASETVKKAVTAGVGRVSPEKCKQLANAFATDRRYVKLPHDKVLSIYAKLPSKGLAGLEEHTYKGTARHTGWDAGAAPELEAAGITPENAKRMAGIPDNARTVQFTVRPPDGQGNHTISVQANFATGAAYRTIRVNPRTKTISISNDSFRGRDSNDAGSSTPGGARPASGGGEASAFSGIQMLLTEAHAAEKNEAAGWKTTISTQAAGSLSEASRGGYNGYYTWPQIGYADASPGRAVGPRGETLEQLMLTPGGAAWWRANGNWTGLKFDTSKGSYSMRRLEWYARHKFGKTSELSLSEGDEMADLDKAFEEMVKRLAPHAITAGAMHEGGGDSPEEMGTDPENPHLSMPPEKTKPAKPPKMDKPGSTAGKIAKGGFATEVDAQRSAGRAEQMGDRLRDPTERLKAVDQRPTGFAIRRLLAEWRRKVKGSPSAQAVQTAIGKGNYAEAKRLMELDMNSDTVMASVGAWADSVIKSGGGRPLTPAELEQRKKAAQSRKTASSHGEYTATAGGPVHEWEAGGRLARVSRTGGDAHLRRVAGVPEHATHKVETRTGSTWHDASYHSHFESARDAAHAHVFPREFGKPHAKEHEPEAHERPRAGDEDGPPKHNRGPHTSKADAIAAANVERAAGRKVKIQKHTQDIVTTYGGARPQRVVKYHVVDDPGVEKSGDLPDALTSTAAWADGVIKGSAGLDGAWLDATLRDSIRDCFRYRMENASTKTDEQIARNVSDSLVARILGYKDATGADRLARLLKEDEEAAYKRALKLVPAVRGEFPSEAAALPGASPNGGVLMGVKALSIPSV